MADDIKIETRGRNLKQHEQAPMQYIKPGRIILPSGVFGETGVGKSYQTIAEAKFYTQTTAVKNGRKVLIFDTNGEYTMFPAIALKSIPNFYNVMICRINARGWSKEQRKEGALYCARYFKLGWLIVDDIDKFAMFDQSEDFVSLLMGGRHEGTDMTICHQSLDMGTRVFYRNQPVIRLHNQASTPKIMESKAKGYYDVLQIAENIVNRQYEMDNDRFFVTINTRKKKIHGCSSKQCFINACKKYLIDNDAVVKRGITDLIVSGKLSIDEKNSKRGWQIGFDHALKKLDVYHTLEPFHS